MTEGTTDESLRHALTKLSHLHFVAARAYGRRVIQMGEEPWRVHVTGTPALDSIDMIRVLTPDELEAKLGVPVSRAFLLVTYHPETLAEIGADDQIAEVLIALEETGFPCVFTCPNADAGNDRIRGAIQQGCEEHKDWTTITSRSRKVWHATLSRARPSIAARL